jgi:hypothetical protein
MSCDFDVVIFLNTLIINNVMIYHKHGVLPRCAKHETHTTIKVNSILGDFLVFDVNKYLDSIKVKELWGGAE